MTNSNFLSTKIPSLFRPSASAQFSSAMMGSQSEEYLSTLTAALTTASTSLNADSPLPTIASISFQSTNVTAVTDRIDRLPQPDLLCSWLRKVYDCRDTEFLRWTLVVSVLLHFATLAFSIWVLWYRNGSFKRSIVTNLVNKIGFLVYPRPLDSTVLLTAMACLMRFIGIVLQLLDMPVWLFILFEQLYWTTMTFLSVFYIIGFHNCLPVTEIQGYFAIYKHDPVDRGDAIPPIYILYLSPNQRLALLITGTLYPFLFGVGPGVVVGILVTHGHEHAAEVLETFQYCCWWAIAWTGSFIMTYYGYKLTVILRVYITTVEAKLGLPTKSFGIRDLNSPSPARYLRIMIQITAYGAFTLYFLAGFLCGLWALRRTEIRRVENEPWHHIIAVLWTCAVAAPFMVKLILIAFHARYSKKARSVIPLADSTVLKDPNTTNAAGPIVQSHNHTREKSNLDQALHNIIQTDSQIGSFQPMPIQGAGIQPGRNGHRDVAAIVASWLDIQDDATRNIYNPYV